MLMLRGISGLKIKEKWVSKGFQTSMKWSESMISPPWFVASIDEGYRISMISMSPPKLNVEPAKMVFFSNLACEEGPPFSSSKYQFSGGVHVNVMGTIHEILPLSRAEIHLFFFWKLRFEGSKKHQTKREWNETLGRRSFKVTPSFQEVGDQTLHVVITIYIYLQQ